MFVGNELCDEITYVAGQAVYVLDCGGMFGNSVKVIQNENILTLCEVQVYGELEEGKSQEEYFIVQYVIISAFTGAKEALYQLLFLSFLALAVCGINFQLHRRY